MVPTTTVNTSVEKLGKISQGIMDEKVWMISKNFDPNIIKYTEDVFEQVNMAHLAWPSENAVDMVNIAIEKLSALVSFLDDKSIKASNSKETRQHIAELYSLAGDLAYIIGADVTGENLKYNADAVRNE